KAHPATTCRTLRERSRWKRVCTYKSRTVCSGHVHGARMGKIHDRFGFDRAAFLATPLPNSYDYEEPTSVYLMECAGFYKIGIAANVTKRLIAVQAHNPQPVTVQRTIPYPS